MFATPRSASWLPVVSNSLLVVLKLGVGLTIGSISVVADGLDSTQDVLSALVGLVAVRIAARPPDSGHAFGHGKAEYLATLVESVFILASGGFVTYQAIQRMVYGSTLHSPQAGAAVMAFSLAVNYGVSWHLARVGRRYESPALEAAAKHRASDVITSLGVLLGLLAVWATGLRVLDAVIALGVAAFVAWIGVRLGLQAIGGLMDVSLPPREVMAIQAAIEAHPEVVAVLALRTRRIGRQRHIEATVAMCHRLTVGEAHDATERIEEELARRFPGSAVIIHVEPCSRVIPDCDQRCRLNVAVRQPSS